MSQVDTILTCLEGNTRDFKICCDIPALSPDIEDEIEKAVAQGVQLRDNIQEVLNHLTDVQMRLARTADEEQVSIMEVGETLVSREALEKSPQPDITELKAHQFIMAEVIMDLLSTASLSDVKADTGLPEERCEEIMAIHASLLNRRGVNGG